MKTRRLPAAIAIALTASLLTACGSGGAEDSEPASGGILRFGGTIVDCADPHQRGNNPSSYALKGLTDSLLAQDLETGDYLPWLATKYEVNDDATEFTFTLRDDVTFSDGTKLTGQVVADNLTAIVDTLGAAAPLAIGYLDHFDSAEAPGEDQVVVHFSSPNIAFLQGTATGNLGIVSDATTKLSAEQRCSEGVVGTGPFVIDEFVSAEKLNLTRRDEYAWANPLAENDGPAYLDGIEYVNIKDTAVLAGALLSDQIDAYTVVLAQDHDRIKSAGGEVFTTTNAGYPVAIVPNVDGTVFSDPAVRKAVQIGFDRTKAIDGVIGPWFVPSTSALSSTTVGYSDLGDSLAYDPEAAKKLLQDAGWTVGAGGIREKDGDRLAFDVTWDSDWNATSSVLAIVKEQLKEIGVELKINLLPTGQAQGRYDSGDFDSRWVNGYTPEPDTLRAVLSIDANNWSRRTDREKLDDLLAQQLAAVDVGDRNEILAEIQQTIVDEGYLIPIYDWAQSFAVSSKVHGAKLAYLSGPGPLYGDLSLSK